MGYGPTQSSQLVITQEMGNDFCCTFCLIQPCPPSTDLAHLNPGTQVAFYTLIPPLASSMMAPALPQIAQKMHITNATVVALTLSIFLLTFAIGPLIFGPLSEIYGRAWVSLLL